MVVAAIRFAYESPGSIAFELAGTMEPSESRLQQGVGNSCGSCSSRNSLLSTLKYHTRPPRTVRPARKTEHGLRYLYQDVPVDGVVLTTGCDKTTPACIMAAATVNIPAIVLSGGRRSSARWSTSSGRAWS